MLLLEHNVYHALRTSDEYVWFYSEKIDWWKGPNIPAGVEQAIRNARTFLMSGQAPAYDMRFVDAANQGLARAVSVSGRVVRKDGAPLPHVMMGSGFYNLSGVETACFSDPNNYYECKLPNGWSGTLTPELKGYRFEPPMLSVTNLTENKHVDFVAIPAAP